MQKEFAKFAASPERVQNITLVSGSMESTPDLSGSNVGKKKHQSLVELEEGEWDTSWDLVFSTHPWLALIEELNETIVCLVVNLDCRMSPHRLRIRMSLWHRAPSSHAMLPPRLGYGAAVRLHADGPFSPHLCVDNFTHTHKLNKHTQ